MYYEVTDLSKTVHEHDLIIRLLIAEDDGAKDIAYMHCSTCELISEYNFYLNDPDIKHLEIIWAECYLHAEGFDVSWEEGRLEPLPLDS